MDRGRADKSELETILSKRQEYEAAKKRHDEANHQIQLALPYCPDERACQPYYDIRRENKSIMDKIVREHPLVYHIKDRRDAKALRREINSAFDDIGDAISRIISRIIEGEYPIWRFDALIEELLEKYTPEEAEQIKEHLARMKRSEDIKDLVLTIGSITLSVLTLLIPGGAVAGLLCARSGLQIAGVAVSVASAVEDLDDSLLYRQEVLAHTRVSPEIQELMEAKNISLTDAQTQLLTALISSAFLVFDLNDAKKSVDLLRKLDNLDNEAVQALKQSKRFGEKAFQNIDTIILNHIGKVEKATKVFDNLSTLDVKQIPEALNFFPNNLNTNVIWLGMDNVEAKTVLTCSDNVCKKYNAVADEINTALDFSKPSKELEEEVNNIAVSLIRNKKFNLSPSEHVTLLKESLPPAEKLIARKLYLRVQGNNDWKTLASPNKSFAWVTDPLMINFEKGIPSELMDAVGFTKDYAKTDGKLKKVFADFVVFKDSKTAEKYIGSNDIIGWDKILDDFYTAMDKEIQSTSDLDILRDTFGELITDSGRFDIDLFKEKYYNYFVNDHVPGTPYPDDIKGILGAKIEEKTGASYLFEGGGITVEDNGGLKSIERPLHRINDGVDSKFDIDALSETNDMRVFRFEVTQDINKPVSVVEIGADSKK